MYKERFDGTKNTRALKAISPPPQKKYMCFCCGLPDHTLLVKGKPKSPLPMADDEKRVSSAKETISEGMRHSYDANLKIVVIEHAEQTDICEAARKYKLSSFRINTVV
jgi:hypothetical protein